MSSAELDAYQYQIDSVKAALVKDPANAELVTLRDELEQLIALTKQELGPAVSARAPVAGPSQPKAAAARNVGGASSAAKAGPSKSSAAAADGGDGAAAAAAAKADIKPGDPVQARYTDGKFYPAKVTTIGGSADAPVYTVIFTGYDQTELVGKADIKALSESKKRMLVVEQDIERDRKRKRNEKKVEHKQAKAAESAEKQKSWQSFTKKASKKGPSCAARALS